MPSSSAPYWTYLKSPRKIFDANCTTSYVLNSGVTEPNLTKCINSEISEPNATKIVHDVEIHSIEPFEIGIALLQSVSKWQQDKVDRSDKNADVSTLTGCHGNVPWKIKKAQWGEQALTPFYQSEIFVKIGPLASETQVLESPPLKK